MRKPYPFPPELIFATSFILLSAFIWIVLSIFIASGLHWGLPKEEFTRWTMATLSLLVALFLIALAILLSRKNRLAYWLTLVLLGVIMLMTLVDQFGVPDLIVVLIHFVPFALLLKMRRRYLYPTVEQEKT